MTAEMQLATVPPKETALQVYSAENGLEPYLQIIRAEIDGFVPDVSTRKGREAIASIAYKVARSKTALDNAGKELVAELKEVPKKIDAERKRMRDLLDIWQAEVRRPLTEWEEAEEARKRELEAWVNGLRCDAASVSNATAEELKISIGAIEAVAIDGEWLGDYEPEAHRVKAASLATLREALAKREQYESEQAELAELRRKQAEQDQKDREERIAREAAEQAKREAETKAQAERDAAAQRERDLELQAERAQREKLEAQQRAEQAERDAQTKADAAAAAERQRQADEQARMKAEADAREKDRAHKGAVLKAAKEAVMAAGITEDQAREVIKLIAAGGVPRVYISY